MTNLDMTNVRGEFKIVTYSRYLLPSMRYHLSIHSLYKTHLQKLDKIVSDYHKKWLEIPHKGCTNVGIYHKRLLGIMQPSQLYWESQVGTHTNHKLNSDEIVQMTIKSKLDHEKEVKHDHTTGNAKKYSQK